MMDQTPPFRWNIARREQLGGLIDGVEPPIDDRYVDELRRSAAKVISLSGGSDLVFVGRSPESYFDYLSGLLNGLPTAPEVVLFQHSGRWMEFRALGGGEREMLRSHMRSLGIGPAGIASRQTGVAFCDLVAAGGTYSGLVSAQAAFVSDTPHSWRDIQRKVRLIGITERSKTSPKTWRWYQHRAWRDDAPHIQCASVSVEAWFWDLLGNNEPKTTRSYSVEKWFQEPPIRRDGDAVKALARAVMLFDLGRSRKERQDFAAALATGGDPKHQHVRALINGLRG